MTSPVSEAAAEPFDDAVLAAPGAAQSLWRAPARDDDPPVHGGFGAATALRAPRPDRSGVDAAPVVDDGPASARELTPARGVVLATALGAATCAALNLALTGGQLTFFFDLCFVVLCLVAAGAIRDRDLFVVGVLPPFVYAGTIAVLSFVAPGAFPSHQGVDKVFLTGLATHAFGLVYGYAATLAVVALRMLNRQR